MVVVSGNRWLWQQAAVADGDGEVIGGRPRWQAIVVLSVGVSSNDNEHQRCRWPMARNDRRNGLAQWSAKAGDLRISLSLAFFFSGISSIFFFRHL
nr:hypothetical protein Itr_chr14CG13030 [Ipomoea trifida]